MLLQSGSDIDAVAVNIARPRNDIPHVYGYAQGDRAESHAFRNLGTLDCRLDLRRPLDSVERAVKHRQNSIPGGLYHPTVMSLGPGSDDIAQQRHPPTVGA